MIKKNKVTLLVDGHVHLYDNFDPDIFINSISDNFKKFSDSDEPGLSGTIRMIFLTEAKKNDFFSRIENNSLPLKNRDIRSENTGEKGSILLKQNGESLFYIIRGRQIVTSENLEILSVGPGEKIDDGLPASKVLDILRERKEIAILAWGVGKWLFRRGKVIKDLIKNQNHPLLLIGDNSARPSGWLKPLIYKKGEKQGVTVINGSDPLPLEGEEKKAGSYFFKVTGEFDPGKPLESLKNILASDEKRILFYGKRDSVISFFKRQSKILRKKYIK